MEPPPVIVDGDVLEARFQVHPHAYERFSHILLCSEDLTQSHAVPYTYVRAMGEVVDHATIRPVEERTTVEGITWATVATADTVLVFASAAMPTVYGIVSRVMNEMRTIRDEMAGLQTLGLFTNVLRIKYHDQVITHLKAIRLTNHGEDGIVWLPENYGREADEDVPEEQALEQNYRVRLCGQIKHRPLPMTRLLPLTDEDQAIMEQVLEFLNNAREVRDAMYYTHYAPMFKDQMPRNALVTLMADEFRCVKNELPIGPESVFIFTDEHLELCTKVHSAEDARNYLRYYVGDYLDELDLSRSYITGSSMAAVLLMHQSTHPGLPSQEVMIDIHYPPVYTEVPPFNAEAMRRDNVGTWNLKMVSPTEGTATRNGTTITFPVRSGADVDIAVDISVTDEEYRAIAAAHFATVKKYYPAVEMREYEKPKGGWNYVIYMTDLTMVPYFRQIEIYRSSFRNICTHHVGAVRCAYTSRWSEKPHFYCTASAIWTYQECETPNYHYFAGRKSNPQDVIVKYKARGVGIADSVIKDIIDEYMRERNIDIHMLPFYRGRNVPYSIFAAPQEYENGGAPRRQADPPRRHVDPPRRTGGNRPQNNHQPIFGFPPPDNPFNMFPPQQQTFPHHQTFPPQQQLPTLHQTFRIEPQAFPPIINNFQRPEPGPDYVVRRPADFPFPPLAPLPPQQEPTPPPGFQSSIFRYPPTRDVISSVTVGGTPPIPLPTVGGVPPPPTPIVPVPPFPSPPVAGVE